MCLLFFSSSTQILYCPSLSTSINSAFKAPTLTCFMKFCKISKYHFSSSSKCIEETYSGHKIYKNRCRRPSLEPVLMQLNKKNCSPGAYTVVGIYSMQPYKCSSVSIASLDCIVVMPQIF